MRTRLIAGIATGLLVMMPTMLPAAPAGQGDPNTVAQQNSQKQPEMSKALEHLAEAKKALQAGSSQHGGHRAKAMQHVDQAIAETEQAIAFYNQQQANKKK